MGKERGEAAPERGESVFLICGSVSGALFRPVPGLDDLGAVPIAHAMGYDLAPLAGLSLTPEQDNAVG